MIGNLLTRAGAFLRSFAPSWSTSDAEHRSTLADPSAWLQQCLMGAQSATGIRVNERTALESPTTLAATSLLCDTFAMTPMKVFQMDEDGFDNEVHTHPVCSLLQDAVNEETSAFTFKETLALHLVLSNVSFTQIQRNRAKQVIGLYIITPDRVSTERVGGKLFYAVRVGDNGREELFPAREILHIRSLSWDTIETIKKTYLNREVIGRSLAAGQSSSTWHKTGGMPAGWVESVGKLGSERLKEISEQITNLFSGADGKHRWMVAPQGHKLHALNIDPEKTQLLESRKYSAEEEARAMRVQNHLVGILDKSSYSNIEEQNLEFNSLTMMPLYKRVESEMNLKLFTPEERAAGLHVCFVAEALLRGRIKDRYEAYAFLMDRGVMTVNEVRKKEGLKPFKQDTRLEPLNFRALTEDGEVLRDTAPEKSTGDQGDDEKPDNVVPLKEAA